MPLKCANTECLNRFWWISLSILQDVPLSIEPEFIKKVLKIHERRKKIRKSLFAFLADLFSQKFTKGDKNRQSLFTIGF